MPPFDPTAGMPSPAAPMAPTPGMPTGDNAPMTPEHKEELTQLLSKVKGEYSKWRSMRFGTQNQSNEFRRSKLKEVFKILQAKGVDLNDPKSVSAFLAELKKTAPQHFAAITKALDYLLGANYETQQQLADPLSVPPVPGGLQDAQTSGQAPIPPTGSEELPPAL